MGVDIRPHAVWLGALLATAAIPLVRGSVPTAKPHSRQKRLLWLTTDGRLALPPGTALIITPTLSLPFVRYPPEGFFSNMSISLPFTINFDKLGLTDNQNPYGVLPPILGRSLGRSAGIAVADYIARVIDKKRNRREAVSPPPEANFQGGERAILYSAVEDLVSNFGLDGKACLLRAICEVHGRNIQHFGLAGEFLKLFFTASQSPFSNILKEYVDAEEAGVHDGECWKYYKGCPKSLFVKEENKYRKEDTFHEEEEENEIEDEPREKSSEDVTNIKITQRHLE